MAGLLALVALPGLGNAESPGPPVSPELLRHLSSSVAARYWLSHPDQAPEEAREGIKAVLEQAEAGDTAASGARVRDVFNDDDIGLPQNEESIAVCGAKRRFVVGGTNDYRGILDPAGNFTGWYLSTDGGRSVANEGLLPPVRLGGRAVPSGGDPVTQVAPGRGCVFYAASLNYDPEDATGNPNGIGVYRTTARRLASCPRGEDPTDLTHPQCWPTRRAVAQTDAPHFLDKEWMDVGRSGRAGMVVWVTFSDFAIDENAPLGFTGAQVKAVRCNAALTRCTRPILISGRDEDIQFSDVTVAADGRTMISWAQIEGELEQTAQTFTIKVRIAPPGSTRFGPTRVVARETKPIPFGGFLHANDFRIATYPKSIMPIVGGKARVYVVWDRCRYRLLDTVCEESQIVMSHSDDDGRSWSRPTVVSAGGDNYFPAISDEFGNPNFVVAYYTHRFDRAFHNRQDVEMVTIDAASGRITNRQRVTPASNETEADPLLGGFFIGDYFDVHLAGQKAYVHYNANYRKVRLLGEGIPIPQQDNYLTTVATNR